MIVKIYLFFALACTLLTHVWSRQNHQRKFHHSDRDKDNDLSLWIDEQQVKMFSGMIGKVKFLTLKKKIKMKFLPRILHEDIRNR